MSGQGLYGVPIYRVAREVDIIDQLSTIFKICLCTMYKENCLDYPFQWYKQIILQERQEQLEKKNSNRLIIGRFVRGWSIILETPLATLYLCA